MMVTRFFLFLASVAFGVKIEMSRKMRPVTRVIKILEDMGRRLQDEQRGDEAIYDKLKCWCDDNGKEKSEAVAVAETRITGLLSSIEDRTARSAQLKTEIAQFEEEAEANRQGLKTATELRNKERAAFTEEQKEVLGTVKALKDAITILEKHNTHPSALVQKAVGRALEYDDKKGSLTSQQKEAIKTFLQASGTQPSFTTAYAPQSGEIFGILRQMKEEFEADMSQDMKDEEGKQAVFMELKAAKEAEIAAGREKIDNRIQEKADNDEANANDKQELEDIRASLSADQRFLVDLHLKCQATDKEWEERQLLRAEEIKAVSEAVAILRDDDAHDLFSKHISFIQVSKDGSLSRAERAKRVLEKARDPRVSALASQVQLNAFARVKKAIDDMIVQLKAEQQDEATHRDYCLAEKHNNEKQTLSAEREKESAEVKIASLKQSLDQLGADLAELAKQSTQIKKQIKKAGEDREAENSEFQNTIKSQREMHIVLEKAISKLKHFYQPAPPAAPSSPPHQSADEPAILLQRRQQPEWERDSSKHQPPPETFKTYQKQVGGGVIALLQTILEDTKKLESDCLHDEQNAQESYENFVKDSNQALANNARLSVDKTENRATAESELAVSLGDLEALEAEVLRLAAYASDVHKACDFVIKNFDLRQTAREEEIDALGQAKAILSGSDFD